nr:MAG TPA: hypothetical protein [Caudoviricetes sp.]
MTKVGYLLQLGLQNATKLAIFEANLICCQKLMNPPVSGFLRYNSPV